MNYEAYVLMSIAVWRIIATIREPVLKRIEKRLTDGFAIYGKELYSAIVWTIAFVIGFGYATMAGADGDMLQALGWTDGYLTIGQAMTAGLIASGSAGMRVAEKLFEVKKPK
jgi:hypothetical protein